jgi:transporter family protein
VIVVAFFATGQAYRADGFQATLLLLNGGLAAGAYICLYRGLELGPVALVSPIVGAYAAITILLAVLFAGESLLGLSLLGTVLTLAGAVLASTDMKVARGGIHLMHAGVPWAIGAMALFGVATFITGLLAGDVGWGSATLLSRAGNCFFVALLVFKMWGEVPRHPAVAGLALATFVGIADVGGIVAYTLGTQGGNVSITTAVSASFILIPVVGGLVFFRERPAASQLAGVALVGGGLVLLGL